MSQNVAFVNNTERVLRTRVVNDTDIEPSDDHALGKTRNTTPRTALLGILYMYYTRIIGQYCVIISTKKNEIKLSAEVRFCVCFFYYFFLR